MMGNVSDLVAQIPRGSLIAVGGRPGAMTVELLYQLAESLSKGDRGEILIYGEAWQRLPRGSLSGSFRSRPAWLGTRRLISGLKESQPEAGVLIDTVPFEERCLSRCFDPWLALDSFFSWCRLTGGTVLLHTTLSRRLEYRDERYIPRWRDLPRPLRALSDGALLVYRPAWYFPDQWPGEYHEIRVASKDSRQIELSSALRVSSPAAV